jgi:hypothetical protein
MKITLCTPKVMLPISGENAKWRHGLHLPVESIMSQHMRKFVCGFRQTARVCIYLDNDL